MSFSLPDIDIGSWTEYQRQELQRQLDEKMQGFTLQSAIDEKVAGLQEIAGGINPFDEPPPPQVAAAPEPVMTPPPEPPPVVTPPPAPVVAPPPPVQVQEAPAGPSPLSSAMQAVQQAGGDVGAFIEAFNSGVGDQGARARAALQQVITPPTPTPAVRPDLVPPTPAQPSFGERVSAGQAARVTTPAAAPAQAGGVNPNPSPDEVRSYITQAAQARGIDPKTAITVANSEGGMEAARRGTFKTGSSWYPFQLHYGGKGYEQLGNVAGMGNSFTAETGFAPGDPAGWEASVDYALDRAKKGGWGAWYGAKARGITGFDGIDRSVPDQPGLFQQAVERGKSAVGGVVTGAQQAATGAIGQVSQFGDAALSAGEAAAACGPAAAVRFAQRFGRNPTLREAVDLAKTVGWTAQQGMAGIASEHKLMEKLGIPVELVMGRDWNRVTQEAQTGNPVTISTSKHYFTIDDYDPKTGKYHVGSSGTDLRGGSDWMSSGQMEAALGGGLMQGALIADNPAVATQSMAGAETNPLDWVGRQKDSVIQQIQQLGGGAAPLEQPITDARKALEEPVSTLGTRAEDLGDIAVQQLDQAVTQVAHATEPLTSGLAQQQQVADELRGQAEQERLGLQDRPYNPLEQVGESVIQSSDQISRAPGQLYGADVAAGEALSAGVIDAAKQTGWTPEPGQELFVRNTLAQVTPSNVLISALTAGQGSLARMLVQGAAELAGGAVGSELARMKAEEAGWPEWAQAGAQLAGGVGGGISGALGSRGAIRAAESPLGQAAIRSRLPAEAEAGFAAGMPTGGRGAPDEIPAILDPDGRLIPKSSEVANDLKLPEGFRLPEGLKLPEAVPESPLWTPEPAQIVSPGGKLLSTVVKGEDVAAIARTTEGAANVPAPSPATLRRMPNLDYLGEDMDDIKGTLQGLAEANADQIDQYKRGTQSWEKLITELAPMVGMSKEDFLRSRIGRGWNEAELLALRAAHLDQTVKAQALADEVAEAGGVKGLTPDKKVDLVSNLLDAARLQQVAKGGGSTAGRTLNQQKIRLSQAQARNITGGNERIVAERRKATATQRAERAEGAATKTAGLQEERAAGIAEAQKITDRPRAKNIAEQINKAYDDLARYQSMTLAEKDEVFLARQAERAEKAAKRAEALQSDDPAAELLKALKTELAAEEKYFGKSRETWMDMAFWATKKDEMLNGGHWTTPAGAKTIPKDPGIAGQAAWLKAQAKAAAKELEASDRQAAKAFNLELRLRDRQTSQALKVLGELGSEKITDNILEEFLKVYRSGDAMATAKFLKGLANVGWWDRANILRYAGMLSATVTHGVQAAGGALNLAMMPATQAIGAPIDIATQAVRGGERTRYGREIPQQVLGMVEGGRASLPEVWEVLKSGISMRAVSQDLGRARAGFGAEQSATARAGLGALYGGLVGGATAPEDATFEERLGRAGVGAIAGGAGLAAARGRRAGQAIDIAAEGPLRLMQASDLFFRGAGRGAQTRSIAYRTARNEGLVGEAALERTNEIMQHLDEFPELVDEAEKAAARVVLQEQREVQRFVPRAGVPGAVFSGVVPFSRTPINITAQGLGMSPAGVAGVIDSISKGQRGEATDRVARTLMGTAIMATATGLAADDHLTGAYPEDAWERSTLPEGWRPWSFKVPDGKGKTNYIPFGQLGGIGYPLAMGAVYGESLRKGEDVSAETLGKMAVKVGRFGADQTMVTGLNNALNAINEPERYAERFFEGLATQAVPLGSLQRQINQALGAAQRDPKGPLEAMLATTVAFAPEVESKISPLGEEVQPGQTGAAAFVAPYRYGAGTAEGEDPVLDALREHEVNIPKGSDIRMGVPFTDDEQRQHQIRSGEVIRDYVERTMATPTYQAADRTKRQVMLQQAVENARNIAAGETLRGIQSTQGQEEIRRRYLEEQTRKQPAPSR